ncbi:MAG: HAMP domain-containing protein [Deinococcaceae bacterium]
MNQFTVILVEKPTDSELIAQLQERLQSAFKLPEAQAKALANKPAGPLLKATTESRARQVAQLYASLGIEVRVVDLSAESSTPAPARQVVSARPVVKPKDTTVDKPQSPPTVASDQDSVSTSVSVSGRRSPEASGSSNSKDIETAPTPSISIRPRGPVSPAEPSIQVRASVQADPVGSRATVVGSPTREPVSQSQSQLSQSQSQPAPSEGKGSPAAEVHAKGPGARRTSLFTKVLVTTLGPLIVLSVSIIALIGTSLPKTLRNLVIQGAQQLAVSVGNTVNLEDLGGLETQLGSLTSQPNVGFIYISSAMMGEIGKSHAKLQLNERLGYNVTSAINSYLDRHPELEYLEWKDNAAGYEFLKKWDTEFTKGDITPDVVKDYDQRIQDASNYNSENPGNEYTIVRVGVYQSSNRRTFGVADSAKASFIVTVGVISNESNQLVRQQIFTLIVFALIVLAIAALVAVTTARQITRPIVALVQAADQISLGKMDDPVLARTNDEIGDLARALERMRVSLTAALERLRKRRR